MGRRKQRKQSFKTIVCDPPWPYKKGWLWQRQVSRSRSKYPVLSVDEICELPIQTIQQPSGYLWLWIPTYHVLQGDHIKVCAAWGYRPVGQLIWVKTKKFGTAIISACDWRGLLRMGLGYYLRNAHEVCVLAVRGSGNELRDRGIPSVLFAPLQGHSEKPPEFYELVEKACRGPYADLFARKNGKHTYPRDEMWTPWGKGSGDPFNWGYRPKRWMSLK